MAVATASGVQLKASVGRNAVNHRADVRLVQKLLNAQIRIPYRYLKEDGLCGPHTIAALHRFQVSGVGMQIPTDHVDPGDQTITKLLALNGKGSRSPVASAAALEPTKSPTTQALEMHADVMREEFAKEHREDEYYEFWLKVCVQSSQFLTKIFAGMARAEDARTLAVLYLKLRQANFNIHNIIDLIKAVAGAGPKWRQKLFQLFSEPTSKCGKFLRSFKEAGEFVDFFLIIPEYLEAFDNGEYGKAAAKCYQFAMGKLVPWGGFIDSLEELLPDTWKGNRVLKVLRVLNPVALGGVAVDSVVTLVNYAAGTSDERELDRLVERMKKSPAGVFASAGESISDKIFFYLHPEMRQGAM